jgi:NADH:ubiquinone oxidoreductase subunit 3 (subunit A)
MREIMRRIIFLVVAGRVLLVIGGLHFFIKTERNNEHSSLSPIERGFVTTGKVCVFLSLQFFVILILFLILDLEVVFLVSFIFRET